MCLCQKLLQACVLDLKIFKAADIICLHTPVLGSPFVEGGFTEAALSANIFDRQARLDLLKKANDLLLGKSTLLHIRHSLG